MQKIKRLLVGLDLTEMDKGLIAYTAFISQILHPEKIYFIHVEKDLEKVENLFPEFKQKNKPADESMQLQMKEEIKHIFSNFPEIAVECTVVEGSPIKEITHCAKIKNVDMILVGQKTRLKGSGLVPKKLARISRSHVLFVPENSRPVINKIMVPLDFSEYSRLALEHAVIIAQQVAQPEIVVQHVYQVPTGHYKIGKSYEEMAERMRKLVESKIFTEVSAVPHGNIPVNVEYTLTDHDDSAEQIIKIFKKLEADLLILGAKGQSAVSAFLLGSHTEKVLKHPLPAPVLVVKKPDEKLSFLDTVYVE
ncbi:MAG: universal stress protein [Hymenobacteraceae bacterium]|nr:universal stress protein [Hymenobacteraceae bacterium]MDX5395801.1 universal stress protein [Hymenobacteraceae bacterium]MDX5444011.1 universal stress protein [Hymenobacteraceae bacterium]MDX5511856.1 universal stress protein [Hymenobacteraceae bacterium]